MKAYRAVEAALAQAIHNTQREDPVANILEPTFEAMRKVGDLATSERERSTAECEALFSISTLLSSAWVILCSPGRKTEEGKHRRRFVQHRLLQHLLAAQDNLNDLIEYLERTNG